MNFSPPKQPITVFPLLTPLAESLSFWKKNREMISFLLCRCITMLVRALLLNSFSKGHGPFFKNTLTFTNNLLTWQINEIWGKKQTCNKNFKKIEMSYDAVNRAFCSTNKYYKSTHYQINSSSLLWDMKSARWEFLLIFSLRNDIFEIVDIFVFDRVISQRVDRHVESTLVTLYYHNQNVPTCNINEICRVVSKLWVYPQWWSDKSYHP